MLKATANRGGHVAPGMNTCTTPPHDLHLRAANCAFTDFFRCNDLPFDINADTPPCIEEGYFTCGGAVCFGRPSTGATVKYMNGAVLPDVSTNVEIGPLGLRPPFDVSQVVTNLRRERYRRLPNRAESLTGASPSRR